MVLTRNFKQTIVERVERDPAFAEALLDEAATLILNGEADIAALKKTSNALDRLLANQGVDVEEVVADFKLARLPTGTRKKSPPKTA